MVESRQPHTPRFIDAHRIAAEVHHKLLLYGTEPADLPQKLYKIFRLGQDVYVVKEDAGEEPDKVGVAKESKAKTSNTRKSSKRTGSIKAVS